MKSKAFSNVNNSGDFQQCLPTFKNVSQVSKEAAACRLFSQSEKNLASAAIYRRECVHLIVRKGKFWPTQRRLCCPNDFSGQWRKIRPTVGGLSYFRWTLGRILTGTINGGGNKVTSTCSVPIFGWNTKIQKHIHRITFTKSHLLHHHPKNEIQRHWKYKYKNTHVHKYTHVCVRWPHLGRSRRPRGPHADFPSNQLATNWKPREMRTSCFRLFSVFFCFVIGYLHLYFCSRDWSVEAISGAQLKSQSDCFCVCHRSQRRERHGLIDKYATNTNGCDPNTRQ